MSISVIIPAYNRADLIGQTLASLVKQTLPADEIIVVDDGSTDSTVEAVEREFEVFRRQYSANPPSAIRHQSLPHLRLIRQENAGPGAARNRGLAEAKGEFIHFFDSDDLAAPNKHEEQASALREGADIAFGPWVKGRVVEHRAEGIELGEDSRHTMPLRSPPFALRSCRFLPDGHVCQQHGLPEGDLVEALVSRWSTVPQACMFRRSILEKSGGFPPQMFAAEDQVLFLRCLLQGAKVVHTPQTLAFYRLGHEGKLTESGDGHRRRLRDWGRFLVIAHEEISAFQHVSISAFSPAGRSRYRERCHAAAKDLATIGEVDSDLARQLQALAGPGRWTLDATSRLRQWTGGLKARLTGCREDASFRCGPITAEQLALFPEKAESKGFGA